MPTKEPRLNIVLDKDTRALIAAMAVKGATTSSKIAADLIQEAIEMEEDKYWSAFAERRVKETKEWVSFEDAWARSQKTKVSAKKK